MYSRDIESALNSNYSHIYRRICNYDYPEPQNYLKFIASLRKLRTVSRLRVSSDDRLAMYHGNIAHVLRNEEVCKWCGLLITNCLKHLVLECALLETHRKRYLDKYIGAETYGLSLERVIDIKNTEHLNNVFFFIMSIFDSANLHL